MTSNRSVRRGERLAKIDEDKGYNEWSDDEEKYGMSPTGKAPSDNYIPEDDSNKGGIMKDSMRSLATVDDDSQYFEEAEWETQYLESEKGGEDTLEAGKQASKKKKSNA